MAVCTALHPVLQQAIDFTAVYRAHQDDHPALREAACLRCQYPALMAPIAAEAIFAGGRAEHRICYVGSIWWTTMADERGPSKQGGYCFDFGADRRYDWSPEEQAAYNALKDFWRSEYTCAKTQAQLRADHGDYARSGGQIGGGDACGFCVAPDLDRLLQLGLPGLRATIEARLVRASYDERPFLQALLQAQALIVGVCRHYRDQATTAAAAVRDEADRLRLLRIAASLDAITERRPASLHEAMQLLWLYAMLAGGLHIEAFRIDVALGDFFAHDIDSGRLDEEEAIAMVLGLWRMWQTHGDPAVCRMIIGGRGRRNEANADRFCLAAMEATRRHHNRIPQLSLRFHTEQDPALMQKAFDVIGDGCVFPVLYNDDVILPGVERALHVDANDALAYHPLGCGEYMLGGMSPSLLNFSWSIPRTLEAALRGGRDATGALLGPATPPIDTAADLSLLADNLRQQADFVADLAARAHASNAAVAGEECAFLLASLLTDDCIERGRSLLAGGARHPGACIMGHGFTNAADAWYALETIAADPAAPPLASILSALADDFEGHEELRSRLAALPKFGNGDAAVDVRVNELWLLLSAACDEAGRRHGLPFLTMSSVNPGGYFMGEACGASADGRRAGQPFAIGNAPTAGNDTHGLTALLTSLARIDAANGGAVSNIKLAKSLFGQMRPKLELLFDVYWQQGGIQASVSVVDQDELRDAVAHPERYPHLLVRLGGWTARFVELQPHEQEEIIRRTMY